MNKKEQLREIYGDDLVFFEDMDYDNAIVGVSNDNRVVYDYDVMIECLTTNETLSDENGYLSPEDADTWIELHTMKHVEGKANAPIIMMKIQ